jgi:putative transposase
MDIQPLPRAKRYFEAGFIWHITHRCHKKDFLLKFSIDRRRYVTWLYQAKIRYGLKVLNYMVTSNHIHLLVFNTIKGHIDDIPRSMQLVAGRTAQEYNKRRNRKGAFWEDRYHVTLIDSDNHLNQCMTYIDMNMVRAGVVDHPKDWTNCGYHEMLTVRKRYTILDIRSLLDLFREKDIFDLLEQRRLEIDSAISKNQHLIRNKKWTETVAVGRQPFLEMIKKESTVKSRGREIRHEGNSYVLKEMHPPYILNSASKICSKSKKQT